jgi:hypothetical protein
MALNSKGLDPNPLNIQHDVVGKTHLKSIYFKKMPLTLTKDDLSWLPLAT